MRDLVSHGFELMFSAVSSEGLDEDWIGRLLDKARLEKLEDLSHKYRFSIDGEGGEFETTVISCPWMQGKLTIEGDINWRGSHGFLSINGASIAE
jgi:diphthamide synthase (EF-2-diphthine--ammonia ligase)